MTNDSLGDVDSERSRAVLGAWAAELAHELQGPLNLFRSMTERVELGHALDAEDASLLREELERLSRMNARLRQVARLGTGKAVSTPARVLELARTSLDNAGDELWLEPGDGAALSLSCDAALLGLALAELAKNALEVRRERAGVRFVVGQRSGFCVWDDGPGFTLEFQQALAWGESTKSRAAGLGLTLTFRAARAHGFELELRREAERTEVWLLIPARELRPEVAKVGG